MELRARLLDIHAGGKRIAILDNEIASIVGVHSSDRVKITYENEDLIAIVNVAQDFSSKHIGLYQEISKELSVSEGEILEVKPAERPEALEYIQAKINGERLREDHIQKIIEDVVEGRFSDIELASLVTSLHINGLSMNENEALSKSMVDTGSTILLKRRPILDKHSIGGVPGDKTTIMVVPIIAAAGFFIPKTSSRAVTSPAGTADVVESLCPVDLSADEIKEIVEKTCGCMVWGGALELAPADDIFIQIEYPLAIDPLLLPSIMSKKKAVSATHLIIDIPTGRGAKVKTIGQAYTLAHDFVDLGNRLEMTVQCAITFGEQPIGYAVGPALEAREALYSLMGIGPADLREKALDIAGILLEMTNTKNGKRMARDILKSGKAEKKLREIIEAQGGNPEVQPEEIEVGDQIAEIRADKDGRVLWVNNKRIAQFAKQAGAPREKGAGVLLKTKLGHYVKKGNTLFEIYAERNSRLQSAIELAEKFEAIGLSKKPEERMLVGRVPPPIIYKKYDE
ncbi:MAG: AMP phosphorylase [Candidatus Bathyarchaeota archaeon]|jgi:AMP phosphorylase